MPTLADWLTSRIPPNSLEAERAVLGVALLDRAGPAALCRTLRAEDFYAEKHRHIYAGIAALLTAQSAVDLLTLPETLRQQGHLEEIGGPAYLGQLIEEAALLTAMPDYCRLIQDKAALRELIRLSTETVQRAYENGQPASEIAGQATTALAAVMRSAGGRPRPAMRPLADLLATPPARPLWLVESLILQGANGWIGAGAKVGKSLLALDLLLACALGQPWLDTFAVARPLTVAFVEEEDSAWRVYERATRLLAARGAPMPTAFFLTVRTGVQLDQEASLGPLLDLLRSRPVDLVFWDVFNRLHTLDEKRPDQMLPLLKRVDRLRDEYGCANLIAHHARKPGVSGPDLASGGQQLRGPSEFWGWAENSLYLKPLKTKGALIVEPESKDALVAPFKVHLEDLGPDSRRWVYDGEVAARVSDGEATRTLILDALALNPMTVGQLVDHTKKTDRTLKKHLGALEEDGAVEATKEPGRAGRKLWMLRSKTEELPF